MVFDILSVIFGILLTVRKLDVSRRQASEFPNVDPSAFERWRAYAAGVYALGSWACFIRVIASVVFALFVAKHLPWNAVRVIGGTIDIAWAAIMIATVVRSGRARRQRDALGIVLR